MEYRWRGWNDEWLSFFVHSDYSQSKDISPATPKLPLVWTFTKARYGNSAIRELSREQTELRTPSGTYHFMRIHDEHPNMILQSAPISNLRPNYLSSAYENVGVEWISKSPQSPNQISVKAGKELALVGS